MPALNSDRPARKFSTWAEFQAGLEQHGLQYVEMRGDGNCLYRAIAHHVYGDQEMHDVVRRLIVDHMTDLRDHYSQFVAEEFELFIHQHSKNGTYGNHLQIQAAAEIYNRPVEIYEQTDAPINIFQANYEGNPPIRLSYLEGLHYDAIVDPKAPAIGTGLGLPGLVSRPVEQQQVSRAVAESERAEVDAELAAAALAAADAEATQAALEAEVLAASRAEAQAELDQALAASRAEAGDSDDELARVLALSREEYVKGVYSRFGH